MDVQEGDPEQRESRANGVLFTVLSAARRRPGRTRKAIGNRGRIGIESCVSIALIRPR